MGEGAAGDLHQRAPLSAGRERSGGAHHGAGDRTRARPRRLRGDRGRHGDGRPLARHAAGPAVRRGHDRGPLRLGGADALAGGVRAPPRLCGAGQRRAREGVCAKPRRSAHGRRRGAGAVRPRVGAVDRLRRRPLPSRGRTGGRGWPGGGSRVRRPRRPDAVGRSATPTGSRGRSGARPGRRRRGGGSRWAVRRRAPGTPSERRRRRRRRAGSGRRRGGRGASSSRWRRRPTRGPTGGGCDAWWRC